MDPAKLETITSFPYTVNTKHLDCFFLGFTNFYWCFICKFFLDLASPLQSFTKDSVDGVNVVAGLADISSLDYSSSFISYIAAIYTTTFLLHFD